MAAPLRKQSRPLQLQINGRVEHLDTVTERHSGRKAASIFKWMTGEKQNKPYNVFVCIVK